MAKISLYINGSAVDLPQGEALLLFTYQYSDAEKPAAVLNSYSREITLPPTDRNNQIFGEFFRPDKVTGTGFDALSRVPFLLRGDDGTNLESGYCKLNSASAREGYAVQLFGGLGGFFYGNTFNEDGTKKSLASLDYGTDLAFDINATTVRAAWDALENHTPGKWMVVNFAPTAQGYPEGEFDARHAVVPVGSAKCPAQRGESGKGGLALVDMGKDFDEWQVRDLRSYHQRPVFNLQALLDALADSGNNGGYTFDFHGTFSTGVPWLALPSFSEINFNKKAGAGSIAFSNGQQSSRYLYPGTLTGASDIPALSTVGASWDGGIDLYGATLPAGATTLGYMANYTVIFVQLVAFDSNNVALNGSDVVAYYDKNLGYFQRIEPAAFAAAIKYKPDWGRNYRRVTVATLTAAGGHVTLPDVHLEMGATYGVHHYGLRVVAGTCIGGIYYRTQGRLRLWHNRYERPWDNFQLGNATGAYTYESTDKVRSGAHIEPSDILSGTASPAELLLGLAKLYGWAFTYDADTRTVSVLDRKAFFDGLTLDIADRIDRAQPYTIRPNIIEAKWLNFALGEVETDWAKQYKAKYGAQYGAQRVNTGSPFNRDTTDVFDGTPFKAPVGVLPYGRYFYIVRDKGQIIPAPWLDNGIKYTLWGNATQNPFEHDVAPTTADAVLVALPTDEQFNLVGAGYDTWPRTQARDADGRAVDITGTLLLLDATGEEHVALTDDTTDMLNANGGTPCWAPCLDGPADPGERIPYFIPWQFEYSRTNSMIASIDVGEPREVDVPKFYYKAGVSVYESRWAAFIEDRYDDDARVCECWVRWSGLQVGAGLLRHFYWFDGCRWVLNKISDYAPDRDGATLCEFIKVGDPDAYTGGQAPNN